MKYILGRSDWKNLQRGEEHSFLLVNGLGGYCSQTVIGSNARHDHNLLTAALVAPTKRFAMVRRMEEILHVGTNTYRLDSQSYVTSADDALGFRYLDSFFYDGLPCWEYRAEGVRVTKRLTLVYGTNSLVMQYKIQADEGVDAWLEIIPVYGFHSKNDRPLVYDPIVCRKEESLLKMTSKEAALYLDTDGSIEMMEETAVQWYRFDQDGPDGRDGWGGGRKLHRIVSAHTTDEQPGNGMPDRSICLNLIYGMEEDRAKQEYESSDLTAVFSYLWNKEKARQRKIMEKSGRKSETARQLAVSAQAHLTRRDSTDGMSIMAGFPFFGDWGRDTMIAFYGCTLAIGEMEAAKSILKTFMRYCRNGIMPNLFPEGKDEVLYNTVDASLLFINALWDYLQHVTDEERDDAFEEEAIKTAESIISWYAKGTDYNIHMEEDGLLAAGSGLWQLTWMDVRFGDILPTPRHGKPVEINAYWYNAVCILRELFKKQGESEKAARLDTLSEKIKTSFLAKFTKPDGTLYDVLPEKGEPDDASEQVRCNQIFALTMPFCMIEKTQAKKILAQVRRELYTPVGLRSLSLYDPQFHPHYKGSQFERDMAYHQGTVWAYPLGDYYRACIRFADDTKETAKHVSDQLEQLQAALREGCLGQIAEIYDGECPGESRGCFAQAWSVAELLRACEDAENAAAPED
ncbi:MAG: amylo-alpha-1,6-glucosidase [Candidatus Choladocola sp.]|nr:amylo-alpha-1,6-glucosidase [Candidatus Choladocola sp.]